MSLMRGPFSRRDSPTYNKVCGRQNGFQPTTMPHPRFPVELLDYIVDHLHDVRDALESCCLVSTSWIPRTRRHLFAKVAFRSENDLQSWKNVFPEPSTSPACYTDHLVICCPEGVTPADAEARRSIRHGFRRAGDLSPPILRILTLTQIPPNMLQQLPISTDSQLNPLVLPH